MLFEALGHDAKGVTYDVVHHFSAEIDDKKQAYIERNFAPQKLFRDVREFIPDDATIATTAYGSKEEIPQDIDIFIGGFVCKDLSTLNSVKKSITDDGETGDTWRAMLSYSKRNRPTIVLIENVVGRREYWNRIVAEWSAAGYEAEWRYCDTKKYYLPQTRVRMYMIAVDRQKFGSRAPAAVAQWKDTMVKLERPCSTPFAAFLKGTATEFGDTLTPPLKSEPAWVACKLKYDRIRSEERLGIKRPVTKWSENGTLRPPDHGNLRWYGTRSSREWECIDVAHLQRILSGYDTRYKMEVWDVSQSIDYYGAPLGIVGCITPSGCDFITDQQTVLTGGQMLRLQGMPNDKLLFGRESQKDLQDLAGNAMSTTVIGASLISALLCGTRYFTKKQSTTAKPLVNQVLATTLISPEASTSHAPKSMDPAAIDINSLVMDAYMTSRLCGCEGTKTVSAASVHVCKACGHTACARHAGNPAHAYTRSISKAARTQSPYEFLKKWSSVFPTRLRFASFPRDFEELVPKATKHDELVTALIKLLREVDIALQYFYISGIERDVGFWSITYTSPQAILKAKIKHGVEWNLYIKSPCTLAGNDALRKVLQQPIAQGIVEASLMTPEWRFFLPYRTTHALTIHASEEFTSSWRSREGLPDYSQETTPMMLSMASEATELEALLGDYCLQPDCGTACNSLYKKSGSENFLFLDPDLVGHPKDDCFVFSNDLARRTYGECRIASASIDPSWRPWSNQSCRSWSVQVTVPGTWLKFSPVLKPAPMSFDASIPTDSALANVSTDCTQAITILDLRVEEPLSTEELLELSWIPEQVKKIPNVGTWHDTAFVDLKCSCAPTTPSLVWNVDTDGSATAREEPKAAATFERALKVRRPVFTIHHADAKQLQIGVNIASLVHRAQGRLHTSSSSKITWRLCTDHADLAPQPFRQFSIQCNSVHDKFKGHLKLQYDLDTAQLQSLAWMKAQESGVSLTLTEVEEAIQASLGWRAESQAQSIVTVNGGVLADRPSFGKTVTTIALIQSEFQEQSAKSLLKQQSHASSIHALAATLVVCPPHIAQQWQSEFSKFLGPEQYKLYNILLIEDYAQLQQCTIEDFEKARVVIVSWSVLAEHDYIAQLAQFAAMPEPAVTEGYGFDAWMNKVTEDMPGRLEALRSEDSFTNFKLSTVKVLQERLSHAEFKDTLPLKVQHGAGYQSFRSMQDTRTTANTIKAKKKAKPQSKAPQPKHAVPFLQLFRFNRIVIDEYHYLLDDKKSENYPAYATVKCIAALNRWVLSGTPALSNFSDVNEIASFLGVKLGRDVYGDGVTMTPFEKKLVDSQTDVQKFLMRTEVMSRQWHQARHERAQEFLDLFVRKNKPSLEHIRCHEVLQPIELNLAHHAIYLELCQQLIAQRMQLKGFKSKTKSDRNDRLNAILKDSASAEDALLRGAFNVDESSITSLIKTRAVEQEIVESEIRDILIGFESLTNDDLEVSRHYDSFKKDVTSLHGLGDGDTSGRIRQLLHEAAAKAQKNPKRLPGMTGLKAVALSKALKMHISQLRELARNLVHRVRSLRFIATIKKVAPYLSSRQEPATFKCSSECTGTASIHQLRLITECGHLACEDCVTVRDNNETCLHAHCSARVTLLDMIKITDLGEPEEAEKQADHGFGNKLSAIAQLLKNTPKEDQCIVFVPNPETISDVADVLDHFNISFHALTGNKRSAAKLVEDFKNNRDEETQKKALIVNLGSESAAGT
jgi:site-specific DNA-cytosine methylase